MAYHHGNLRIALVDHGFKIVAAGGADGLSLREVAKRAKVSATAVYRHFADKDALVAAIAERGFGMLNDAFAAALAPLSPRPPLPRLRALGVAYVDFALAQPGLYRVMFNRPVPTDAVDTESQSAYATLEAAVAACCPPGTPPQRVIAATVAAWSLVHGYALLRLEGKLALMPPEALPDTGAILESLIPSG